VFKVNRTLNRVYAVYTPTGWSTPYVFYQSARIGLSKSNEAWPWGAEKRLTLGRWRHHARNWKPITRAERDGACACGHREDEHPEVEHSLEGRVRGHWMCMYAHCRCQGFWPVKTCAICKRRLPGTANGSVRRGSLIPCLCGVETAWDMAQIADAQGFI